MQTKNYVIQGQVSWAKNDVPCTKANTGMPLNQKVKKAEEVLTSLSFSKH
jgi:hypothetical protein